ncbi:MAG: type II toxin-antitoxin system YafQ family toxin [Bacteroidales bacterium]|nr:type II toxin-antitoxin system YafQ family toxin [Bacteroidales bacterium]
MKYRIEYSTTFKRSYKLAQKRGLPMDALNNVVRSLAEGDKLDAVYRDHALTGQYKGCRECHIQPDWLLIYRIKERLEILNLVDTGTHADLFGKNKR